METRKKKATGKKRSKSGGSPERIGKYVLKSSRGGKNRRTNRKKKTTVQQYHTLNPSFEK